MRKLIYLCPVTDHPVGGVKVIYRHSQLINQLLPGELASEVVHPENLAFRCCWFRNDVALKTDLNFNPGTDYVVIPEVWSVKYSKVFRENGINYAIFVQNGYRINRDADMAEVYAAYADADLILTNSADASACCTLVFPDLSDLILRLHVAVDAAAYNAGVRKENLITYMPRKQTRHAQQVMFFLRRLLPPDWRTQAIDNLHESEVIDLLQRSRIFMSFSELEGLGLPPIEAALSGNRVIGYTGEGGKEYWDLPIFTEIACGDIRAFANAVLGEVNRMSRPDSSAIDAASIRALADRYSPALESAGLLGFAQRVRNSFKE